MKSTLKHRDDAQREAGSRSIIVKDAGTVEDGLIALKVAAQEWIDRGRPRSLGRWLRQALDDEGVPKRLRVSDWIDGLEVLGEAVRARPEGWPEWFDVRIEGFFRAVLTFSRPDGTSVFIPPRPAKRPARATLFRFWASRLSDPGLSTVVNWWFPPGGPVRHSPPHLPADARPDRVLAILRASWRRDGDFLAVDHRAVGETTAVELVGKGKPWLGPRWTSDGIETSPGRARPTLWQSQSAADVLEWSFPIGRARVTRTAVLLRGRRIALLAEQWSGPDDPGHFRLSVCEGVDSQPLAESRGFVLAAKGTRTSAQVLPLGLPRLPYPTDRGSFDRESDELVLRAGARRRRSWRPLLVSWDPTRNRRAVHWRTLTVSENSKPCDQETAFAARVSWGRDETLLIYRSLARPALRSFLGHQTRARFLIGLFSRDGEVQPLVKIED